MLGHHEALLLPVRIYNAVIIGITILIIEVKKFLLCHVWILLVVSLYFRTVV